MKKILIIGSEGSMGKRYQAILYHLRINFECLDPMIPEYLEPIYSIEEHIKKFDGFIIACPTQFHYSYLNQIGPSGKPILCEKPITKDYEKLEECLAKPWDITMMFQYHFLLNKLSLGEMNQKEYFTYYNYFRTGNDGLFWDCMQIIGLHRGSWENLKLLNVSPTWSCKINNVPLRISEMDQAYIIAVESWVNGHRFPKDFILNAHKKVLEYNEWYQSHNSNSGEIDQ